MKITEYLKKDSWLKAALIIMAISAVNLFSLCEGTSYVFIAEPYFNTRPAPAYLAFYLVFFAFVAVRAVKCRRNGATKEYSAFSLSVILTAAGSFIVGGFTYPIFNAISLNLKYLFGLNLVLSDEASDWLIPYLINLLFVLAAALVCTFEAFSDKPRRLRFEISPKILAVTLSTLSMLILGVYGFAYEKFEYWFPYETKEEYYAESSAEDYLSHLTQNPREAYNSVENGEDLKEAEGKLMKKGFFKENTDFEAFVSDNLTGGSYYANLKMRECLDDIYSESIKGKECYIYSHITDAGYVTENEYDDTEDDYGDIISGVVLSCDGDGRVIYKLFIPNLNIEYDSGSYMNKSHGEETFRWFEGIEKGADCEASLNYIRKTGAFIFESEKSEGKNTVSEYKILINCFYPVESDFVDFFHGKHPREYEYDFFYEIKV